MTYQPYETPGMHLSDLFNSVANFANAAAGVQNDWIEKQAAVDTMRMKAQLDYDTNDLMLNLSQRNDYENFQQEVDNFLQQKQSSMQNKDSPYYCRNPYTAKQFESIMLQNRNELQNKVRQVIVSNMQSQDRVDLQQTFKLLESNHSGQELVDLEIEQINTNAAKGTLGNPESVNAIKQQVYDNAATQEITSLYKDIAQTNPNMTASEIEGKVTALVNEKAADPKSYFNSTLNREKDTANAIQEAQRQIKIKQNENDANFISQNTSLLREAWYTPNKDPDGLTKRIMQQVNILENQTPYDLRSEDQRQRIAELRTVLDLLQKGDTEGARKEAAAKLIEVSEMDFIQAAIAGKAIPNENGQGISTAEAAKSAWLEHKKAIDIEKYGDEEGFKKWKADYIADSEKFISDWQTALGNQYSSLDFSIEKLKKCQHLIDNNVFSEIMKKNPDYAKTLIEKLSLFTYDRLFHIDESTVKGDGGKFLNKAIDDFMDKFTMEELEQAHWYTRAADEAEINENNLNKATRNMQKDLIFTDARGAMQTVGGEEMNKQILEAEKLQLDDLHRQIGKNKDIQKIGYSQTENGTDRDSIQTYMSDGVLYRYAANEGYTRLSYSTDGKTWKELPRTTYESEELSRKGKKAQAANAVNEAAANVRNQMQTEDQKAAALLGLNKPLNGAKQDDWDQLDIDSKLAAAHDYLAKNREQAEKELKEKYGSNK